MKHKDLAKAWLDGAEIQYKWPGRSQWITLSNVNHASYMPEFKDEFEYRLKPTNQVIYAHIEKNTQFAARVFACSENNWSNGPGPRYTKPVNAKLTFDVDTGELKAVEFLK